MRQLGYKLSFPNTSLQYFISQKHTILSPIKEHRVISIPKANLKPK